MSAQIDIDDELLDLLKRHAEPFTDTPNSVLRRLLGLDHEPQAPLSGQTAGAASPSPSQSVTRKATRRVPGRGRTHTRAAPGTLLPEKRYEQPLLAALVDLGGRALYRDVVDAVGKRLDSELAAADREKLASGSVRWQNRLQFVRLRLVERGLLDRNTPRGVWGITDEGRAAIEK